MCITMMNTKTTTQNNIMLEPLAGKNSDNVQPPKHEWWDGDGPLPFRTPPPSVTKAEPCKEIYDEKFLEASMIKPYMVSGKEEEEAMEKMAIEQTMLGILEYSLFSPLSMFAPAEPLPSLPPSSPSPLSLPPTSPASVNVPKKKFMKRYRKENPGTPEEPTKYGGTEAWPSIPRKRRYSEVEATSANPTRGASDEKETDTSSITNTRMVDGAEADAITEIFQTLDHDTLREIFKRKMDELSSKELKIVGRDLQTIRHFREEN